MKNNKEMTPMKRYKTTIDNFRDIVRNVDGVREINLNKSESKNIPWPFQQNGKSESKGVESDFIMFFKKSSDSNDVSFGLAFNYIGLPTEEHNVTATIKNATAKGGIVASVPMKIEEFKDKMKIFIKTMNLELENKNKKPEFLKVMEKFSEIFLDNTLNIKNELKERDISITNFLNTASDKLKISEIEKIHIDAAKNLLKHEANVKERVANLEEQTERTQLLERVKELDFIIASKTLAIKKDEQINERKKLVNDTENKLTTQKVKLAGMLDEEIKDLPVALKNIIRRDKLNM